MSETLSITARANYGASQASSFRTSSIDDLALPLVITPQDARQPGSVSQLVEMLRQQRATLHGHLNHYGALLIRGFPINAAEDMEKVVAVFDDRSIDYVGGTTPRTRVLRNIFTSTEITRFYKIKLHNELAFQPNYPAKIYFYCQIPAQRGGETIIADCRAIIRDIDPAVLARFREQGVIYARVFQKRKAWREFIKKFVLVYFHLTWEQVFNTSDRASVEEECRRLQLPFAWRENGDLEVRNHAPAVIRHPDTNEELWFNHVTSLHFNPETLDWIVYLTRKLLYRERDLPTNVYYGNGDPIPHADLRSVYDAIDRHTVAFPWQAGDLLVLDNRLVAHGRNPYRGPRRVLVAMSPVGGQHVN
jgi:alpha-ketoglutarate-dependent taurine dioxygenase